MFRKTAFIMIMILSLVLSAACNKASDITSADVEGSAEDFYGDSDSGIIWVKTAEKQTFTAS